MLEHDIFPSASLCHLVGDPVFFTVNILLLEYTFVFLTWTSGLTLSVTIIDHRLNFTAL